MVGRPVFSRRLAAPESTRRMSATLDSTPLNRSNLLRVWPAMIWASEVLPVPGRAVKYQGLNAVRLDGAPQQLAGTENMGLPDEVVKRPRTHPRRQRALTCRRPLPSFVAGFR